MIVTRYGKIKGKKENGYTVYRGIPYAQPPVGSLRWKAPQEIQGWDGIFEAKSFRNACMQSPVMLPPTDKDFYSNSAYDRPFSEDCLYLHIWVPDHSNQEKMPVAFWIHGGAYLGGWGSEMEFDGKEYCEKGIIFVSFEYRCNVFGFLTHPWLNAENEKNISGNYGILDQIAALKWVYENIECFGGDPNQITVFGQSAGAMSTQVLVSSPLSKGMIHRAIMQSGGSYGGGIQSNLSMKDSEKFGEIYVELLGAHSIEELREMSAEKIISVLGNFVEKTAGMGDGMFKLIPNIDGYVLTDTYENIIDSGQIANIPYMLGTTKNDILVTSEMLQKNRFSDLYQGCINFSLKLEEIGFKPAYVYYFTHDLPGDNYGAWHSSELWYMFNTMDRCWRPWEEEDYQLRNKMIDYWTNFIKYGKPDGISKNTQTAWQACTKANRYIQELK